MKKQNVCINPSEIAEGDLMAYVYGESTPQVNTHVAHCAFCAAEVEKLRLVDAELLTRHYREACPTAETLAAFVFEQLSPVEKLRVAAHVRICEMCAAEVARGREFVSPESPTLLERLREALALALVVQPMTAGVAPVRGAGWQGRFEADDVFVTLSLHDHRLTGRVRWRSVPPESDLSGQVWLVGVIPEVDLPHGTIDARGHFELSIAGPGTYALLLRIGDQYVAVEALHVTG